MRVLTLSFERNRLQLPGASSQLSGIDRFLTPPIPPEIRLWDLDEGFQHNLIQTYGTNISKNSQDWAYA